MEVWLRHWKQSPIITMEASGRAKAEKSKSSSVNCGSFAHFFSIAMAWCIMNSCQNVVRSIRNTTLKICADCEKQFIRNEQKELLKSQSWTLHHDNAPVHTSLLVHEFLAKNKTAITIFSGLGAVCWLFPLHKTKDTDERKAFFYHWGDKRKIETGAIGDTKKRVSEVFRELEITLA